MTGRSLGTILLSCIVNFLALGQVSAAHQEVALELDLKSNTSCQSLGLDHDGIFARCKIGQLNLVVQPGRKISGLVVQARFRASLRQAGDQVSAAVGTYLGQSPYRSFSSLRWDESMSSTHPSSDTDLLLELHLPTISACQEQYQEELSFRASYFVNHAAGNPRPDLKFLEISLLNDQVIIDECGN